MINRRDILIEEGMGEAPPWKQTLFWRQYNAERRRRGRRAALADTMGTLAQQMRARSRTGLGDLVEAWEAIIPVEWQSSCRVEALKDGRLSIGVDSSAMKYQLSRAWGTRLAELLNERVGRSVVKSVDIRLGSRSAASVPAGRGRKGS